MDPKNAMIGKSNLSGCFLHRHLLTVTMNSCFKNWTSYAMKLNLCKSPEGKTGYFWQRFFFRAFFCHLAHCTVCPTIPRQGLKTTSQDSRRPCPRSWHTNRKTNLTQTYPRLLHFLWILCVCLKLRIIHFHPFQAFRAVTFHIVFSWILTPSSLVVIRQQYVPRNAAKQLSEYTVS
jgi:hypothetical protein